MIVRAVSDKDKKLIYFDCENEENPYNYIDFEDEAYIYTIDDIISSYLFDE